MTKHKPRIFMSYNPVSCWINDYKGDNIATIHSTIDDNPFVNESYRKTLDKLKKDNYNMYLIYRLGLEGQLKGMIYDPHTIIKEYPKKYTETIYGIDFEYNTPAALLEIGQVGEGENIEFYEKEIIYKTKLITSDIIDLMKERIPFENKNCYIYGDSASPDQIEEISRAGFNIHPCVKGAGSVYAGLMFCKRFTYYTTKENTNLISENDGYVWKETKDGQTLDEPVKWKDHLMDCRRYAIYTHYKDRLGMPSLLEIIKDYDVGDTLESAKKIL